MKVIEEFMDGETLFPEDDLIRTCSWCDKIEGPHGEWDAISPETREKHESEMRLTHGICPPCYIQNANSTSP